jgi:hypothetical protein
MSREHKKGSDVDTFDSTSLYEIIHVLERFDPVGQLAVFNNDNPREANFKTGAAVVVMRNSGIDNHMRELAARHLADAVDTPEVLRTEAKQYLSMSLMRSLVADLI